MPRRIIVLFKERLLNLAEATGSFINYLRAANNMKQNSSSYYPNVRGGLGMPTEIKDVNEFVRISEKARYCLVKRLKGVVKLKLRTRRMLYTLKVSPSQTDEVLKKLRCEIHEI